MPQTGPVFAIKAGKAWGPTNQRDGLSCMQQLARCARTDVPSTEGLPSKLAVPQPCFLDCAVLISCATGQLPAQFWSATIPLSVRELAEAFLGTSCACASGKVGAR